MFKKTTSTWSLVKASWNVLKTDNSLLLFPLLSSLCMLVVLGSFVSSYWWAHDLWPVTFGHPDAEAQQHTTGPLGYLMLFLFYFCSYSVASFFNSGLIFCALAHMQGEKVSTSEGFRQAVKRLPLIISWAFVAASVGMVLRLIAERSNFLGKIISGIFGIAFSLASFFVIPVMVAENKDPIAALKESAHLFTKTWGKQLKGGLGFGAVFLLFWIPVFVIVPIAVPMLFHGSSVILALVIGVVVSYSIILLLGQSTLNAIFQAALYLYSKNGSVPSGYDKELLQSAVEVK